VGNPLGFIGALTTGVVHALGPLRGVGRQAWVQAAVRLAPGNSGGPLANARGQVIGVNTMIAGGGLALAVPSNAVAEFLRRGATRPALGITVRPCPGMTVNQSLWWCSRLLRAERGLPRHFSSAISCGAQTGSVFILSMILRMPSMAPPAEFSPCNSLAATTASNGKSQYDSKPGVRRRRDACPGAVAIAGCSRGARIATPQ